MLYDVPKLMPKWVQSANHKFMFVCGFMWPPIHLGTWDKSSGIRLFSFIYLFEFVMHCLIPLDSYIVLFEIELTLLGQANDIHTCHDNRKIYTLNVQQQQQPETKKKNFTFANLLTWHMPNLMEQEQELNLKKASQFLGALPSEWNQTITKPNKKFQKFYSIIRNVIETSLCFPALFLSFSTFLLSFCMYWYKIIDLRCSCCGWWYSSDQNTCVLKVYGVLLSPRSNTHTHTE